MMTDSIKDFLAQPLWLTLPLMVIYIGLLCYVGYVLWRYRHK